MLVRFFGLLCEITKETEQERDVESPSSLLNQLSREYGPEWDKAITFPGTGKAFLGIICVNGRCLCEDGFESLKLHDMDTVMIIPPLKGG